MLQANSALLMNLIRDQDKVLDIGGWAHPFNRADYIMDAESYATRGFYNRTFAKNNPYPPIGGTAERFTKETWIQRDICEKTPFPFRDKELDWVICSHTLEDIRDPLWVCYEMQRIAKRGYIEVPSRAWESSRGIERGMTGLSHHRWLIDIGEDSIKFLMKFHSIHRWRYSLPASFLRRMPEEKKVQWMFWGDSFEFAETTLHGAAQTAELERFVSSIRPYSGLAIGVSQAIEFIGNFSRRAVHHARRRLGISY